TAASAVSLPHVTIRAPALDHDAGVIGAGAQQFAERGLLRDVAQQERDGPAQRDAVGVRERQRAGLASHPAELRQAGDGERAVTGVEQLDEESAPVKLVV